MSELSHFSGSMGEKIHSVLAMPRLLLRSAAASSTKGIQYSAALTGNCLPNSCSILSCYRPKWSLTRVLPSFNEGLQLLLAQPNAAWVILVIRLIAGKLHHFIRVLDTWHSASCLHSLGRTRSNCWLDGVCGSQGTAKERFLLWHSSHRRAPACHRRLVALVRSRLQEVRLPCRGINLCSITRLSQIDRRSHFKTSSIQFRVHAGAECTLKNQGNRETRAHPS